MRRVQVLGWEKAKTPPFPFIKKPLYEGTFHQWVLMGDLQRPGYEQQMIAVPILQAVVEKGDGEIELVNYDQVRFPRSAQMKKAFMALVLGFALVALAQYMYMSASCVAMIDSLFRLEQELNELAPLPRSEDVPPRPKARVRT